MKILKWLFFSSLVGSVMLLFFPEDVPFRKKIMRQIRNSKFGEDLQKELDDLRAHLDEVSLQLEEKSERLSEHVRAKCEDFLRSVQTKLTDLEEKSKFVH